MLTVGYKRELSASWPVAGCEHDLHHYEVCETVRTCAVRGGVCADSGSIGAR